MGYRFAVLVRAVVSCSFYVVVFFAFSQRAHNRIQTLSVPGHKQDFCARKQMLSKIYGVQLGLVLGMPNGADCARDKGCVCTGASQTLVEVRECDSSGGGKRV